MSKILIFFDEQFPEYSIHLLEAARQIDPGLAAETFAVCLNLYAGIQGAFDHCIQVQGVAPYDIVRLTNCLDELHQLYRFDCILIPATQFGRMLAPRLAMRLRTGLVADVTAIKCRDGMTELQRPAFDGKLLAAIVCPDAKPLMASIRAGIFSYSGESIKKTQYSKFVSNIASAPNITLIKTEKKEISSDIRNSRILVSGGGGVGADFQKIEPLAKVLGGMVAASRRIVDTGVAPRAIQVGQSGKIVSPKLYIALGIYGSLQHVEGLKNVEYIIAVNANKDAPICSFADIVVEGDAFEFVDRMVTRIKRNAKTPAQ